MNFTTADRRVIFIGDECLHGDSVKIQSREISNTYAAVFYGLPIMDGIAAQHTYKCFNDNITTPPGLHEYVKNWDGEGYEIGRKLESGYTMGVKAFPDVGAGLGDLLRLSGF